MVRLTVIIPLDWIIYVRITDVRLVFNIDCRVKPDNDKMFKIATTLIVIPQLDWDISIQNTDYGKGGLFLNIDCRVDRL